jgi:uncharacterized membrane protein YbhN (UPF0104 family)
VALALGLAVWAVWDERTGLSRGLRRMPVGDLAGSVALAFGAVGATFFVWRAVLNGLGISLPAADGARVYFVGQLGKYVPGSVWPVLAQMELARRRKVDRKAMLAGATVSVVLSVAVGAIVACVLLPFAGAHAFHRYWWILACVPVLLLALHPRVVVGCLNWLLARVGRQPLEQALTFRAELNAAGWAVLSWLLLGGHVFLLVHGLGASGFRAVAAAVAAGCVAVAAGIILIPVPAGAGVREVAFVVTLSTVLPTSSGLLVALLSRAILVTADLALAAGSVVGRRARSGGRLAGGVVSPVTKVD